MDQHKKCSFKHLLRTRVKCWQWWQTCICVWNFGSIALKTLLYLQDGLKNKKYDTHNFNHPISICSNTLSAFVCRMVSSIWRSV